MADIVAYLYVSHYFDQEVSLSHGQQVLKTRAASAATRPAGRAVGRPPTWRRTGRRAPARRWSRPVESPRYLPKERREVPWPLLTGQELADMAAFLGTLPRAPGAAPRRTDPHRPGAPVPHLAPGCPGGSASELAAQYALEIRGGMAFH